MSETTSENATPVVEPTALEPTPAPDPVKAAAAKISIRELLDNLGKSGGLKILKERPIKLALPSGEAVVDMVVRELSKNQYDKLLIITTKNLPEVPTIEQKYTQARRDPVTGNIKPAGSYFEPNPGDPNYIASTQRWFNDTAILFGLFASAEEFGFDLTLDGEELEKHVDERLDKVTNTFPTTTLLDISYEAALINRGIPIAEQLVSAVEAHRVMARLDQAESDLEDLGEFEV